MPKLFDNIVEGKWTLIYNVELLVGNIEDTSLQDSTTYVRYEARPHLRNGVSLRRNSLVRIGAP